MTLSYKERIAIYGFAVGDKYDYQYYVNGPLGRVTITKINTSNGEVYYDLAYDGKTQSDVKSIGRFAELVGA